MSGNSKFKLSIFEYVFHEEKLNSFLKSFELLQTNYEKRIYLENALRDTNSVLYTIKSYIAECANLRVILFKKLDEFEMIKDISAGFRDGINMYRFFLQHLIIKSPYYQEVVVS